MTTIQNTINSSTPGLDLYNALATPLAAIGASLVDTQVISTRTHKVWKFPAAINAAGLDWYLDISYVTGGGGNLTMIPMEFYDPATHLAYRMPIGSGSTTFDATTCSQTGSTGASLEATQSGITAATVTTPNLGVISLTTTSFGYWFDVTGDRVVGNTSNDPTAFHYSGMYTPYSAYATKAGVKLFPLICARIAGNKSMFSNDNGNSPAVPTALTRMPPAASAAQLPTSGNWTYYCNVQPARWPQNALISIPGGTTVFEDQGCLALVVGAGTNANGNARGILGELINVAICLSDATVTIGSTVTISGIDWIITSTNAGGSIIMKTS